MRRHKKQIVVYCLIVLALYYALPSFATTNSCEVALQANPSRGLREQALSVAPRFFEFFKAASSQIRERDYVIEPMQLAWLAKEHMLLIGPPGNAKTTITKILMSNVKQKATGQASFFATQMTSETSLADTHGGINYKVLNETGRQERLYDEGVLGSHFAFFDEQFDMRPNGYRNVLDVLAERAHSQGNRSHVGKTWTVVGASNTFIPEVYAKFDGSEQPRALIDRYSFVIYVPAEMQMIENNRAIIQGSQKKREPLPELTFEDIEKIQALVPTVEIPDHVADLLSLVQYRLRPMFESTEQASIHEYNEKVQNGEKPLPPYRSTKYMSPRTLGKAAGILKAAVVLDYLKTKGQRSLTASIKDLAVLEQFYALNGPSEAFIQTQMSRASKEVEKEQLKNLMMEKKLVHETFQKTIDEFQQALTSFAIQDIHAQVLNYKNLDVYQRRSLMDALAVMYQQALEAQVGDQTAHTPEKIAQASMTELIQSWAQAIEPQKSEKILKAWAKAKPLNAKKLRGRYGYNKDSGAENEKSQAINAVEPSESQKGVISVPLVGHNVDKVVETVNVAVKPLLKENNNAGIYFISTTASGYFFVDESGKMFEISKKSLSDAFGWSPPELGVNIISMGPFLRDEAGSKIYVLNVNKKPGEPQLMEVPMGLWAKDYNNGYATYVYFYRDNFLWAIARDQDRPDYRLAYDPTQQNPISNWEQVLIGDPDKFRHNLVISAGKPFQYDTVNLKDQTIIYQQALINQDNPNPAAMIAVNFTHKGINEHPALYLDGIRSRLFTYYSQLRNGQLNFGQMYNPANPDMPLFKVSVIGGYGDTSFTVERFLYKLSEVGLGQTLGANHWWTVVGSELHLAIPFKRKNSDQVYVYRAKIPFTGLPDADRVSGFPEEIIPLEGWDMDNVETKVTDNGTFFIIGTSVIGQKKITVIKPLQ